MSGTVIVSIAIIVIVLILLLILARAFGKNKAFKQVIAEVKKRRTGRK